MKFHFEHRSNGLSYVTVIDEDKTAGAFSCATAEACRIGEALEEAGIACTQEGEPVRPAAAEQD